MGRIGTLSYTAPEIYARRGADLCQIPRALIAFDADFWQWFFLFIAYPYVYILSHYCFFYSNSIIFYIYNICRIYLNDVYTVYIIHIKGMSSRCRPLVSGRRALRALGGC